MKVIYQLIPNNLGCVGNIDSYLLCIYRPCDVLPGRKESLKRCGRHGKRFSFPYLIYKFTKSMVGWVTGRSACVFCGRTGPTYNWPPASIFYGRTGSSVCVHWKQRKVTVDAEKMDAEKSDGKTGRRRKVAVDAEKSDGKKIRRP